MRSGGGVCTGDAPADSSRSRHPRRPRRRNGGPSRRLVAPAGPACALAPADISYSTAASHVLSRRSGSTPWTNGLSTMHSRPAQLREQRGLHAPSPFDPRCRHGAHSRATQHLARVRRA
jgi:hypothetical protein